MKYKSCHVTRKKEGGYTAHLWTDDGYKTSRLGIPCF